MHYESTLIEWNGKMEIVYSQKKVMWQNALTKISPTANRPIFVVGDR